MGRNYFDLCGGNATGQAIHAGLRNVIDGTQDSFSLAYPIGGEENQRWFLLRARRTLIEGRILVVVVHEDITERKAAETALRTRNEWLERSIEGSSDGIWDWDLRTNELIFSLQCRKMLGYTDDDELPQQFSTFEEHLHPDDYQRTMVAIQRHINEGVPYDIEFRLRTKQGEYRWFRVRGKVVHNDRGEPMRMAGSATDIHELKRTQTDLLTANERLDLALRGTTDGLWEWRADVREGDFAASIAPTPSTRPEGAAESAESQSLATSATGGAQSSATSATGENAAESAAATAESTGQPFWRPSDPMFYSPRFKAMLGYEDHEFANLLASLIDHLHPEDLPHFLNAINRHQTDGGQLDLEYRLRAKSGEYRWFRCRGDGVRNEQGRLIRIAGSLQDVTDRKLAQTALKDSEERARSIVDTVVDGIVTIDEHGVIQTVNRAVEGLTGYKQAELVGQNVTKLMPEKYRAFHKTALRRYLETGEPRVMGIGREVEARRKDGSEFTVEVTLGEFRRGSRRFFTGVMRDTTERNAARQALLEKDQQLLQKKKLEAVGSLAGGIAHEFNNLLQVIISFTNFAVEDLPEDDPRRADLTCVMNASYRAAELTRQLLQFSRRDELHATSFDMNALVGKLAQMLRPLVGEQIELQVQLGENVGQLHADPALIQQMLMNLCINARDAMPEGGKLAIQTERVRLDETSAAIHGDMQPGDYILLTVADTGCGMAPDVKQHLFEPFYTTKEVGQGTGLGLAMVYGVVQQHRGGIQVESEPGRGTMLRIYLPATEESVALPAREQPSRHSPCDATILVAEDEEMVRELAARILRKAGYRVLTANDGEHAVELFGQHADSIDLAVLDVLMPKLNGHQVRQAIHDLRPSLPVIYCSGHVPSLTSAETVPTDDAPLVQKPFDSDTLLRVVQQTLDVGC